MNIWYGVVCNVAIIYIMIDCSRDVDEEVHHQHSDDDDDDEWKTD